MALQVRVPRRYSIRLPKPVTKDDEFCNDAYASQLWTRSGIQNHDLVLYVTANHTKDCRDGALAYTLPCMTDMVTGRPVAAGMNVCPLSLRSSPRRLLNTLVHECVHALVSTSACPGGPVVLYQPSVDCEAHDSRSSCSWVVGHHMALHVTPPSSVRILSAMTLTCLCRWSGAFGVGSPADNHTPLLCTPCRVSQDSSSPCTMMHGHGTHTERMNRLP